MNTIISIDNLNCYFGENQILKNVNIKIPEKKITVILGPSGCGKTTLLKCMNRLTDLNENVSVTGSIFFEKEDILHTKKDITQIRKRMGLISQRPYPLPMSIFDNVAYGLRINGEKNKMIINEKVIYYLNQVKLYDEVKNRMNEPAICLSIGQQQRLCLARGLAVEPSIILADEPTSSLDPLSASSVEERFQELKDQYTIIIVTHILRQARRLADYVVFFYMGEIIEQGLADDIFNFPKEEKTKLYFDGFFN